MVPGTVNFRDLGGLPAAGGRRVRAGRVFRSDALWDLGPGARRVLVEELGVGVTVDLRGLEERAKAPLDPALTPPVLDLHLPLWDSAPSERDRASLTLPLSDKYVLLAQMAGDRLARVLRALVDAPAPVAVFCSAGKDRTGVVSALLLGALGVAHDDIVADYARTGDRLDELIARLHRMRGLDAMLARLPEADLHARPETIAAFLDLLDEVYGGVPGYLHDIGLDATWVDLARARLLEDA